MLPALVSAQDHDLHPQKINRHLRFRQARETHGVFFRRHDHVKIAADAAIDETLQLRLAVAMVIGVALGQFDARSEFAQAILETFRRRDAAKGTDIGVAQALKAEVVRR